MKCSLEGDKQSSALTCSTRASLRNKCLIYNGCSVGKLKQQTSSKLLRRSSACRDFNSAETSGLTKKHRKVHYEFCLKWCRAKPRSRAELLLSQITQLKLYQTQKHIRSSSVQRSAWGSSGWYHRSSNKGQIWVNQSWINYTSECTEMIGCGGVPQGSILGPLAQITNTNKQHISTSLCRWHTGLYASNNLGDGWTKMSSR